MSNAAVTSCRLCLVTPPDYEPAAFAGALADALSGGDVASAIIMAPRGNTAAHQSAAELLVPVAAKRGVAALIHNDTRICERTKADGVHIDGGVPDLRAALDALGGRKIVGAGGIPTRDEAMAAGEAGADYLFFGRLDGDTADEIFPKALDLASWWASVTVIPAMVMGGRSVASVATAARNSIDFVALSSAVWGDRRGPRAAVADAVELLAMAREAA